MVKLYEPPGVALDDGAAQPYVTEGTTEEQATGTPSRLTWLKRGTASTLEKNEVAKAKIAVNESDEYIISKRVDLLYYNRKDRIFRDFHEERRIDFGECT